MKKDGVQTRKRKPRSSENLNGINNEIKRRTNGGQNQHTRAAAAAAAAAMEQMQSNTLAHLQMQNNNSVLSTSSLVINNNISTSINNTPTTHLTMDFGSGEAIITVAPVKNSASLSSSSNLNHGIFLIKIKQQNFVIYTCRINFNFLVLQNLKCSHFFFF